MQRDQIRFGCLYFSEKFGVVKAEEFVVDLVQCSVINPITGCVGDIIRLSPSQLKMLSIIPQEKEMLCATVNINVKTEISGKALEAHGKKIDSLVAALDRNTEAVNRSKDIFELPMGVKSIRSDHGTPNRDDGGIILINVR